MDRLNKIYIDQSKGVGHICRKNSQTHPDKNTKKSGYSEKIAIFAVPRPG